MRPAGLVAIGVVGVGLLPYMYRGVRLLLAIGIGIVIGTLFLLLEIVPVTSTTLVELGLFTEYPNKDGHELKARASLPQLVR